MFPVSSIYKFMNIKQIFKSDWGFGSSITPGLGAGQRSCESFHYKQTKKMIKIRHKKMFKTTRDIFLVLLIISILLK